ncbi:MAG: hypothetical protein ACTSSP_12070 [Candidatus Asgardarchaeia archaeon]
MKRKLLKTVLDNDWKSLALHLYHVYKDARFEESTYQFHTDFVKVILECHYGWSREDADKCFYVLDNMLKCYNLKMGKAVEIVR